MKFRLKAGGHSHTYWREPTADEKANSSIRKARLSDGKDYVLDTRRYEKGDIVESDVDLVQRFGANKFEKITEAPQVSSSPNPWDNLESMTVKQLKAFAESQEIDLGGATGKQEILEMLRSVSAA